MPAVRPGFLSTTPTKTFGLGSSDSASLRLAFPKSPIFNELNDQAIRDSFDLPPELQNGQINDGGYAWGLVDRNYQQTPKFDNVPVGGGGLPASPYGPNIASPDPSDPSNPLTIPASGVEATELARSKSNGAYQGNNLTPPSKTTAGIAPRRLGQYLPLGVGSGNTFINRT